VIRRGVNELRYYLGKRLVRKFGVATGQSVYPTPTGQFHASSSWSGTRGGARRTRRGERPEGDPTGARQSARDTLDGPVGARRRYPRHAGLRVDRLFGLPRLYPDVHPDAEWLFQHVRVGTPVVITDA